MKALRTLLVSAAAVGLLVTAAQAQDKTIKIGALFPMLELARALATKPQLLLIDEPAAGLNAAEVDTLLDRIRSLRSGGTTVVLVEHNMDLVMNVADRIMVMDYGRHLFEGVPAEVQKNPAVIAAYLGGELS